MTTQVKNRKIPDGAYATAQELLESGETPAGRSQNASKACRHLEENALADWPLGVKRMRERDFRRIALGMEGAIESAHMGHPDFRVNNRIFATLQHDRAFGALMLTPDQQQRFLREHPDGFDPASGAWGRGGSTIVRLDVVPEEALGEAMTLAWQNAVAKGPSRSARKRG